MPKSNSHEEMLWYINQTYKNGWSRSMVLNQITMKSYERSLIEPTTTETITTSIVLKEYGKGYSISNLKYMMQKVTNHFFNLFLLIMMKLINKRFHIFLFFNAFK